MRAGQGFRAAILSCERCWRHLRRHGRRTLRLLHLPAVRSRASRNLATPAPRPAEPVRESDARGGDVPDDRDRRRELQDLPLEFFARVIWQESRFQPDAVGPVTRSGQRAQGIAQFMPGTADERGLLDPFNPVQALPKSAEFLSELREPVRQSRACGGRLQRRPAPGAGMARRHRQHAAGDPQLRVRDHRHQRSTNGQRPGADGKMPERAPTSSCRELMALLKQRAQSLRRRARAACDARRRQAVGVQLAAGFNPRQGARNVCARDEAPERRDRRPGPEPARAR